MVNTPFVKKQISTLLWAAIKKIPKKEQLPMLMSCLEANGYIIERPPELPDIPEDPYAELYSQIIPENQMQQDTYFTQDEFDLQPGYNESSSITAGPFNDRTYIQGDERLSAINQRGISSEEQDYIKVREQIGNALNQLHQADNDSLLNVAMNMFLEIKKVYAETKMFKGEIKGSIRNGYILLVLYYALLSNKVCVTQEQLSVLLEISLADLPKADKNIKMIFENRPGYNFIHRSAEICLCNMRKVLDFKTIQLIEEQLKRLKVLGKIGNPASNVEIASVIHHITKRSFKVIGEFAGISDDTIRKKYHKITF
jgi:hypothetical protein